MQTTLKVLALLAKGLGILGTLNTIPGVTPEKGVLIFFGGSLLKDIVNRVGDFLDDGKENQSFGK